MCLVDRFSCWLILCSEYLLLMLMLYCRCRIYVLCIGRLLISLVIVVCN